MKEKVKTWGEIVAMYPSSEYFVMTSRLTPFRGNPEAFLDKVVLERSLLSGHGIARPVKTISDTKHFPVGRRFYGTNIISGIFCKPGEHAVLAVQLLDSNNRPLRTHITELRA
ncbi:MAG TPA: hypothetical protein PKA31_00130 [Candidatus Moranbacteria bacterium]|nr:hypothetical protein [Candidatus Moranbacteria bacterium]